MSSEDDADRARDGGPDGPRGSYTPQVLKFGGTSVGTAPLLRRSLALAARAAARGPIVVVVSAHAGVTNQLVRAADLAAAGDRGALAVVAQLRERLAQLLAQVAVGDSTSDAIEALGPALTGALEPEFAALEARLEAIVVRGGADALTRAGVMASGERLSAPLFAALLRAKGHSAVAVDAARLIVASGDPLEAAIDSVATAERVRAWWLNMPARVAVVTGFIAGDANGATLVLGRGGSDLSATTLGAALGTARVTLWSDVDGVLDADPREVPQARTIARLDSEGATLLARHGARVLHPRALTPARLAGFEVRARQTRHPARHGTRIAPGRAPRYVAIASDRGLVQLQVRASMSANALADALRARAVPVLSSVASAGDITLLLPASSAACARLALASLAIPQVLQHSRDLRHAVVAVVTHRSEASLIVRVHAALAAAGLRAALAPVASTARSVAVIVPAAARVAAVQALHAALAQAQPRVDVVLIGARGRVARALARLLAERSSRLPRASGLDLRIVGAATRDRLLWSDAGLSPATLAADVEESGAPADRSHLLARILHRGERPRIVVDCTASEEIAALYPELLAAGIGVVTPNKRANARALSYWRRLQELARASGTPYRYSTTVGAGLPVLASARALRRRGDRLRSIEAVLSGSVSAILYAIQNGVPFSAAVADAQAKGFTEPHPAEDLSGEDVARKLLVVLREAGLPLERSAIHVDPLVGGELAEHTDPAGFLAALSAVDAHWHARVIAAQAKHEALVFVARYDGVRATVAVESRPASDALARLRAGENIAVLHTDHHDPLPLTLAGPGAGAELTAAGVLTDLIEAARDVAARAAARRRNAKAARAA